MSNKGKPSTDMTPAATSAGMPGNADWAAQALEQRRAERDKILRRTAKGCLALGATAVVVVVGFVGLVMFTCSR